MAVVRFDTYRASSYLVWQLKHAGAHILDDGGDIILVRLPDGQQVSIHLIESIMPPYEVRSVLSYNEANNAATLFILWADMLLPPDGHVIEAQEWEVPLLAIYQNRIFAWETFGPEIFIFAVHYQPDGRYYAIRYGETLNMRHMHTETRQTFVPGFTGVWRVAAFTERQHHAQPGEGARVGNDGRSSAPIGGTLESFYLLLQVDADASRDDIKFAYRRLARKYHPDLNKSPDATRQMQAINEAYQKLLATLDDEE
jgi:hypothetical protein